MVSIQIRVLQSPEILIDQKPCILPYQKAEALLYYMAIEKKSTRDQVATLLWESCDEISAKKNLRHALYTIKKSLGVELLISSGRQTLIFNKELPSFVDFDDFDGEGLISAYQGELLQGFYLKNSTAFEEWLRAKRTFVTSSYLKALYQRLSLLTEGDIPEAEQLFERYLREEELDEDVYSVMMELYEKRGLYYKGIRLYQKLSALLEKELAASPGKNNRLIYKRLLQHLSEASQKSNHSSLPPLTGREAQLHLLSDGFRRFLTGSSVAFLFTGESGIGKTKLIEHFLKQVGDESCLVLQFSCLESEQPILLQAFNILMMKLDGQIKNRQLKIDNKYMEVISYLFPMFNSLDTSQLNLENASVPYNYSTVRNLLLKFFFSLSQQIPLLFFFDNIQFMDEASLDLLIQLIRSQSQDMMFLATSSEPIPEPLKVSLLPLFKENQLISYLLGPYWNEGSKYLSEPILSGGDGFISQTLAKIRALPPEAMNLLSLLSACQTRGDLRLFEDLLGHSPLFLLDLLDELKVLEILNERAEGKNIYYSFRNNSISKAIYEQMSPSRCRYFHEILASHLTKLGGLGASHYECLIYHYSKSGNEALEFKYRVLLLEDYAKRYYELYPMRHVLDCAQEGAALPFLEYCDSLENRLLSLSPDALSKINTPLLYISLLRTKAQYCIAQGSYEQGLESIQKALLLNRQTGKDPLIHIRCLRLINFYRLNLWKTKDLETSLTECLQLEEQHCFKEEFAVDCRLFGLFLAMNGNYKASLRYLKRSLRIFTDFPLKSRLYTIHIAACHNYIGETLRKQKQFEKAIESYQKAISLAGDISYPGSPVFYSNLARAYLAMGEREKSAEAFYISDTLYKDSASLIGRSITKGYVSLIEAEKGNMSLAERYILQAEESARKLSSPYSLGFLVYTRYLLRYKFKDSFQKLLPLSADEYREEAIRYLRNIPGTYELEELL